MKKLSFYILLVLLVTSCNSIKRVAEGEQLLTKNTIFVDDKKTSGTEDYNYVIQRPNAKALGIPLSLYFYNLGNPDGSKNSAEWEKRHPKTYKFFKNVFSEKQSIGVAKSFIGINNWFLTSGQAPVIIDDIKINRTVNELKSYYFTEGYFQAEVTSKRDTVGTKKGAVNYYIGKGKATFLDSISKKIMSPVLDSIYEENKKYTFLKSGDQYNNSNFENEAKRITKLYRNNGVYHFNLNSIGFHEIDTASVNYKTNVDLKISDRIIEEDGDYFYKPYKIQKIKKINVYTDYTYSDKDKKIKDSLSYKGVSYLAHDKLKYNPKYLSQSLFIHPNEIYSDSLRNLTRSHLRGLKNFKTNTIKYRELNDDELEANIYLTPIEKYTLGFETELSRSNIRNFDVSGKFSILNRNTFRGAEIFKLSVSGSYFNSNNGPGWELGTDLSLEVPRFMAPFGLNKLVPKRMSPTTSFYTGLVVQRNIGLDKQNINVGVNYKWNYNSKKTLQLEVLNAQYIRNLNVDNYFNVYASEYSKLNTVAQTFYNDPTYQLSVPNEVLSFMSMVATDTSFATNNPIESQSNLNILNRYNIISSDFLIPVIAYNFTYNNQSNYEDQDFSYFRIRIANSGNVMGLLSNQTNNRNQKTVFKIPVAQYFKTDIEYKKFWQLGENSVLGFRAFTGVIMPYGDSDIPFSKSYFAGGSNDIRAWKTYDLGPGTRQQGLEYNIGSFKFLSSLEYRFDLVGSLKSAIFIDAGNIWDITGQDFIDDASKFNGFSSIKDLAVGAGFGLRYDFKFLVARLDLGFKAHEPYLSGNRWFRNFNFGNTVYNIGINYPF
ncbi:hypothetical protein LPB136_13025 [Tenacibaculum todarodis]|uniref:Bacterial surface antigen (D15) domain-containing protein n=1 Tax=Tenacibaculum todarodis TaxID=1850252 RepID=A0A1L3JMC6_9FLAO|nr:BamA/TamA family outer membrane protein [Tenacibaculum todarodis]APG66239.1 hypothetical protein LPB136_13025 [Tenacibaculum todarodis]